jgi:hypothetical protein
MVTTMYVHENGDLELPPRPRRRLRLGGRRNQRRPLPSEQVPTDLGLSTLVT